jgi:hypothetical protein
VLMLMNNWNISLMSNCCVSNCCVSNCFVSMDVCWQYALKKIAWPGKASTARHRFVISPLLAAILGPFLPRQCVQDEMLLSEARVTKVLGEFHNLRKKSLQVSVTFTAV